MSVGPMTLRQAFAALSAQTPPRMSRSKIHLPRPLINPPNGAKAMAMKVGVLIGGPTSSNLSTKTSRDERGGGKMQKKQRQPKLPTNQTTNQMRTLVLNTQIPRTMMAPIMLLHPKRPISRRPLRKTNPVALPCFIYLQQCMAVMTITSPSPFQNQDGWHSSVNSKPNLLRAGSKIPLCCSMPQKSIGLVGDPAVARS